MSQTDNPRTREVLLSIVADIVDDYSAREIHEALDEIHEALDELYPLACPRKPIPAVSGWSPLDRALFSVLLVVVAAAAALAVVGVALS